MRIDKTLVGAVATISLSKVTACVGRRLVIRLQASQLRIILDLRLCRAFTAWGLLLDDVFGRKTTKVAHIHVDIAVIFLVFGPLTERLWFTIRTSLGTTLAGRGWLGGGYDGLGWRSTDLLFEACKMFGDRAWGWRVTISFG